MDGTVLQGDAGFLRNNGLCVDGRHAEEGDDPHPEDCTGTANEDRTARADDVAGTDLRRDCRGQCLERTHAAIAGAALEGEVAEHFSPAFAKAAHLHKVGLDGVEQSDADEQNDENVIREVCVDGLHDFQ